MKLINFLVNWWASIQCTRDETINNLILDFLTSTSGIANVRKTYQDNGGWSAQVFYKDVNGKTKGKKFYFSTYGEDRAVILATEYVTQMKKLITEERTRLEQLKESMYAIC